MRGSAMSRSTFEPGHQERAEEALRQSGRFEDLLDGQRAAWHIGRVLQHGAVASHQRWRGEAQDLPEGEIPWHDRQHDPDWLECDVTVTGVGFDVFVGEKFRRVLGVEVAVPGALLDLSLSLDDGLAHLVGRQR